MEQLVIPWGPFGLRGVVATETVFTPHPKCEWHRAAGKLR